jgi:hypothetical protein
MHAHTELLQKATMALQLFAWFNLHNLSNKVHSASLKNVKYWNKRWGQKSWEQSQLLMANGISRTVDYTFIVI